MMTIVWFQHISQLLTLIEYYGLFYSFLLLCLELINVIELIVGVYFIKNVIVRISFVDIGSSVQLFSGYFTFLTSTVSRRQRSFWSELYFKCHFLSLEGLGTLPHKILIRSLISGWTISLNFHLIFQSLPLIFLDHNLDRILIFHSLKQDNKNSSSQFEHLIRFEHIFLNDVTEITSNTFNIGL